MPQNPAVAFVARLFGATTPKQVTADAQGILLTSNGGGSAVLNVTAAAVIKATPGRIAKITILGVVGTGGALTLNDCAATADAAATNQIYTSVGTIAVGTVVTLDWPCAIGIVISAVPTGGTPRFAVSYT